MKQQIIVISVVVMVCLSVALVYRSNVNAQTSVGNLLNSPLPTPIPTATTIPHSPEAEVALKYIAEQKSIPIEKLIVSGEEPQNFLQLGRKYILVTLFYDQPNALQVFSLLVDPVTKKIEEDVNAVQAAELAAHRSKYGKFHPALYERLQSLNEEETELIVVWAAHSAIESSPEVIQRELGKLYPEAAIALKQNGVPWAVKEPKLAVEIEQKYKVLSDISIAARVQPIIDWLKERGYTAHAFQGMPALAATVIKRDIIALAELNDVVQIYLNEQKTAPMVNASVPTDRVPTVWSRGITGSNVKLAILERNKINPTASNCMNIVDRGPLPLPSDDAVHKSWVATIAACNDTNLHGVADGAQILDAAFAPNNPNWFVDALIWAVDTKSADVVNLSEGQTGGTSDMYWTDRAFDYWIRARQFTAAIPAGNFNNGPPVLTPGKGWNVITVGGIIDKADSSCGVVPSNGNANWSDDVMWNCSSYGNPTNGNGVEKPEVVAVANNTTVIASDKGTSGAAPQVAGLATLLMQRNGILKDWPSIVKSIIMASAVHNIEGSSRLSGSDGAGSIDAALADKIAQTPAPGVTCLVPCWWGLTTNTTLPGVGGNIDRYFNAIRGERVRVVISWLSQADPPNYMNDSLLTNYDLFVYQPNGTVFQASTSTTNNFEIVDFTAPETGQYTLRVYRNSTGDQSEASNFVGVAWVKDATYLPDIRGNSGGWNSSLYVRNDDSTARDVKVTFINPDGTFAGEQTSTGLYPTGLPKDAVWSGATPPANWQGSAIVDGGEGLSVVARLDGPGFSSLDNGFLMGGATDPAFEQSGATLYVPAIYNNIFGGLNSTLYVQNVSPTAANLTLNWYGRSGYADYTSTYVIAKGGRIAIAASSVLGGGAWVGSLRIGSNQPVAAKVLETSGATTSRSFNAAAGGRSLVYVPAAYKNEFSFNTGLVIQNLDTVNDANVIVTYCNRTATSCIPETAFTLKPLRATGINVGASTVLPANWSGSVKIENVSGTPARPLAVAVTNSNSVGGYDFNGNGSADAGKVLFLPRAAKNASGRTTGFTVRNVSGGTVTVTAFYYNADGTLRPSSDRHVDTLTSAQTLGYHQSNDTFLADGWQGSIVLQASGAIVAVMREDSADTVSGYNGISH